MPGYEQAERIGSLKVPGEDDLVLVRFSATEAIGQPFAFEVLAVHEDGTTDVDIEKLITKNVSVAIGKADEDPRWFDGMVVEAIRNSDVMQGMIYTLRLRPWTDLLVRSITSRIFKNMSVKELLSKILGGYGKPFTDQTTGTFPKIEYLVQYRESDWNFLTRLMDDHGITYHFMHKEGEHELILVDVDREALPGVPNREYIRGERRYDQEALYEWEKKRSLQIGKVRTSDHYFEQTGTKFEVEEAGTAQYEHADLEEYVPLYAQSLGKEIKLGEGSHYARYRLDTHQSRDHHFTASGEAPGLIPGYVMGLEGHPTDDAKYIILSATHQFTIPDYRSGDSHASYSGSYEFFPEANKPYLPPHLGRKPLVSGIETAIVVNEADGTKEDIDVDKYGRIVVRFHWKIESINEKSMRVRVAQMWAGAMWGTIYWPRDGMEVLVSFINGDPDRPLVVGTVYNNTNMPPFDVDNGNVNKNISGVKSLSTKGGGGYNQFTFDDSKGNEMVTFHAEKDQESTIKHNVTVKIGNNRTTEIKGDETLTVEKNILIEAKQTLTLKVGKSTIVMDKGSITIESPKITVHATADLTTQSDMLASHTAGGNMTISGAIVKIN